MPNKGTKRRKNTVSLKFGSKSIKMNDIILLDTESFLEKYDTTENNENIPSTIKKDMLTVCGYSMAHLINHDKSFTSIVKNGRDSLEHLCNVITEYAKK